MKFVEPHPLPDPDKAARKLAEVGQVGVIERLDD
jgi:hypothetical protein